MKTLALILSLIILVLSIVPCPPCDSNDSLGNKECHRTSENCKDDCKACSPFYACGTCIGFIFPFSTAIKLPAKVSDADQKEIVYHSLFISSFANAIWQPPKIA